MLSACRGWTKSLSEKLSYPFLYLIHYNYTPHIALMQDFSSLVHDLRQLRLLERSGYFRRSDEACAPTKTLLMKKAEIRKETGPKVFGWYKNGETPDFSGVSGECIYFGHSRWRSGRDSNPREVSLKLISSQPRYDHFDTAAYLRIIPHFWPLCNTWDAILPRRGICLHAYSCKMA